MTGPERAAEYAAFKAARHLLELELAAASSAWRAIAGVGSGPLGLTPDSVKCSPEYAAAARRYRAAHMALRDLNGRNVRRFARELAADRAAARQAAAANLGRAA